MFGKKNIEEFEDVKEQRQKVKLKLTDIVTGNKHLGSFLSNNILFIIFLAALVFWYIHNSYVVEGKGKYRKQLNEQVQNLKAEATTTGAELMRISSQSKVKEEVERRGLDLKESTNPPTLLKSDKKK